MYWLFMYIQYSNIHKIADIVDINSKTQLIKVNFLANFSKYDLY